MTSEKVEKELLEALASMAAAIDYNDPKQRSYTVGGRKLPPVTGILEQMFVKPALVQWAASLQYEATRGAVEVARNTRPIIFVGDRIPPASIWPGRVPPIVALSQVTILGENGLVVDHDAVLAAILDVDTIGSSTPPTPVTGDQLALIVRRQVKAEAMTQLTDDILVAAYQQEWIGPQSGGVSLRADGAGSYEGQDPERTKAERRGGGGDEETTSKTRVSSALA